MKRYIQSAKRGYGYGGKYRYWDDPKLADKITDTELDDSTKTRLFEDILDDIKYNTDLDPSDKTAMWDYFVNRVTIALQDILEYDYPDASWPTWYEDAKRRFDEWWMS